MKKSIALFIVLVLVLSCTSILCVACNKDKGTEDTTPSNSETIVTAAVMASSMGMGQASSSSEQQFKAGIDLSFNVDGLDVGAFKSAAEYGYSTVANIINASLSNLLNNTISSLTATLGSNSISIENEENSENVFIVTVTIIDEDNEQTVQTSQKLRVTIDVLDGSTIESTEFSYNVKVEVLYKEEFVEMASFTGSAKYSDDKQAMEFAIGENNEIVASGAKDGTINIKLTLQDDEYYSTSVDVSVKGGEAKIVADVRAMDFGEAVATINVKAGSDFKNFIIAGTFDATLRISNDIIDEELIPDKNIRDIISAAISFLPTEVKATGDISGQAVYDSENGFEVGLAGEVVLTTATQKDSMWVR